MKSSMKLKEYLLALANEINSDLQDYTGDGILLDSTVFSFMKRVNKTESKNRLAAIKELYSFLTSMNDFLPEDLSIQINKDTGVVTVYIK